jgi:hypothetical protein
MKRKNVVFRILLPLLLASTGLFAGCSNPPKLKSMENLYGTGGGKYAKFHRIAEADRALGLRYPGFLVGIEKGDKQVIDPNDHYKMILEKVKKQNKEVSSGNYRRIKDILSDPKRTFISHIAEYQLKSKKEGGTYSGIPYIGENLLYNAYEKKYLKRYDKDDNKNFLNPYENGSNALITFNKRINEINKEDKYTHVFLYCMGWNTDQQESLRNYNSLLCLLIENYDVKEGKPFRPLFVGISWPSLWSWRVLEKVGVIASFFTKADDADEVGLIWGNRILRDILIPFKKEQGIPLVLIGHSLGARVLTRSLFSSPLIPTAKTDSPDDIQRSDVDLVIGLEGAFSVRRFLFDKGLEGYPYVNFSDYAKNYIFTWSEHDKANPMSLIYGSRYIGGKPGYIYSKNFDLFRHYRIRVKGGGESGKIEDSFLDKNFNRVLKDDKYIESMYKTKTTWEESFNSTPVKSDYLNKIDGLKENQKMVNPISIVNATELIYYKPYYKGGNAHNDIYTPGVAKFIWKCIDISQKQ